MTEDLSSNGDNTPSTVKKPWPRRVARGLWNVMAVFGLLAVLATLGGLIYGLTHFSGMSGSDLSNVDPIDVPGLPAQSERLGAQLDLPADYIEARVPPIVALSTYTVPLAVLSLRTPYERVLVYSGATSESLMLAETDLEAQDPAYACDGTVGEYWNATDDLKPLLKGSLHCSRELLPYEAKSADAQLGHVFLFLFVKDDKSLLLQVTMAGDETAAKVKLDKFMGGFSWK